VTFPEEEVRMSTIAMAFPRRRMLDTWHSGMREIAGPRREEFEVTAA
jgi:hypothetical protein